MATKNLITINQNSKAILNKAKSLVNITNKILENKSLVWKDPDTILIWQVKIDKRDFTWDEAFEYAKELNRQNYGGYNDWRVPSIDELKTILTKEAYYNKYS